VTVAKRKQIQIILALTAGLLAGTPALAVKNFSAIAAAPESPAGSNVLYGATHGADNFSLNGRQGVPTVNAVASVPEPAGWLMMLVGFGLLGAMTRRSTPHPIHDELSH
jgi:hypothetical protein